MDLALRSKFLGASYFMELACLARKVGSGAVFPGSGAPGDIPNRP